MTLPANLRFNSNRRFKILHFSDIHWKDGSPHVARLISAIERIGAHGSSKVARARRTLNPESVRNRARKKLPIYSLRPRWVERSVWSKISPACRLKSGSAPHSITLDRTTRKAPPGTHSTSVKPSFVALLPPPKNPLRYQRPCHWIISPARPTSTPSARQG